MDFYIRLKTAMLTLLSVLFLTHVDSANVLLLPLPATSHCREVTAVGTELANRGHNVTLLVVSFFDATRCMDDVKLNLLVLEADEELNRLNRKMQTISAHAFQEGFGFTKALKSLYGMTEPIGLLCHRYLTDKSLKKHLQEAKFDLAIVDGFPFARCLFALPYVLGVPIVSVSSVQDDFTVGQVFQGNSFPHMLTGHSNEMGVLQRLSNMMVTLMMPIMHWLILPKFDIEQYQPILEHNKLQKIVKESLLHLENSDYIIEFPKATFPNFVQVGGLTVLPPKPLSPEFEEYLEKSEHGIILVVFGDTLKGAPKKFIDKLITAFSKLKENVIFKHNRDEDIKNIRILKWVPQRDLLGHPKLKLIVTHCGKNTFYEALYNGVPILCTPLHGDNFAIARAVTHFGAGATLNIISASEEEIVESINSVVANISYDVNMKKASALYRDRPESPRARAANAVEHVLKYGGDHLKPGGADLSVFQYTYGDIWLIVFAVLATIAYLLLKVVLCICCRPSSKSSKEKQQ